MDEPSLRKQKRAAVIMPTIWERYREEISTLYQSHELKELMKIMEQRGFHATDKQYKRQFSKWKLKKYVRASKIDSIVKSTPAGVIPFSDNIPQHKIKRFVRRKSQTVSHESHDESDNATTPSMSESDGDALCDDIERTNQALVFIYLMVVLIEERQLDLSSDGRCPNTIMPLRDDYVQFTWAVAAELSSSVNTYIINIALNLLYSHMMCNRLNALLESLSKLHELASGAWGAAILPRTRFITLALICIVEYRDTGNNSMMVYPPTKGFVQEWISRLEYDMGPQVFDISSSNYGFDLRRMVERYLPPNWPLFPGLLGRLLEV